MFISQQNAPSGDAPRSRSMRASSRIATFHKTNPIPDAMVRGPQRYGSKIKAKPPRMLFITISIATILLFYYHYYCNSDSHCCRYDYRSQLYCYHIYCCYLLELLLFTITIIVYHDWVPLKFTMFSAIESRRDADRHIGSSAVAQWDPQ